MCSGFLPIHKGAHQNEMFVKGEKKCYSKNSREQEEVDPLVTLMVSLRQEKTLMKACSSSALGVDLEPQREILLPNRRWCIPRRICIRKVR